MIETRSNDMYLDNVQTTAMLSESSKCKHYKHKVIGNEHWHECTKYKGNTRMCRKKINCALKTFRQHEVTNAKDAQKYIEYAKNNKHNEEAVILDDMSLFSNLDEREYYLVYDEDMSDFGERGLTDDEMVKSELTLDEYIDRAHNQLCVMIRFWYTPNFDLAQISMCAPHNADSKYDWKSDKNAKNVEENIRAAIKNLTDIGYKNVSEEFIYVKT